MFRLGGVFGCKGTIITGVFVFGKGGRVAFRTWGTKLICSREHIRWAALFLGTLEVSGPLDCKFWSCAYGKNWDALF